MTALTFLDHQQRTNSLRRKDKLWIYKNPQGLMILEDVIYYIPIYITATKLGRMIGIERKKKKALCKTENESTHPRCYTT
jgi:hypothetical protein